MQIARSTSHAKAGVGLRDLGSLSRVLSRRERQPIELGFLSVVTKRGVSGVLAAFGGVAVAATVAVGARKRGRKGKVVGREGNKRGERKNKGGAFWNLAHEKMNL